MVMTSVAASDLTEVSKHTCMFCDGSGKQKVEPKEGEVEEEKAVKAHLTWVWKS